jgi:GLPGLI family protein
VSAGAIHILSFIFRDMKVHSPLLVLLFTACLPGRAQVIDSARYIFDYQYRFMQDSTNRHSMKTEDMVLLVGGRSSYFIGKGSLLRDSLVGVALSQGKGVNEIINDPGIRNLKNSSLEIYKFITLHSYRQVAYFFRRFEWTDSLPTFHWQLSQDTEVYNGYACLKATTFYRGRLYTALFCPAIPLNEGPWKFYGLPGLIVRVSDLKQEVLFDLTGSYVVPAGHAVPIKEQESIQTTKKEYFSLRKAAYDDPLGVARSITGHDVQISGAEGAGPRKPPVSRNAIELQ